jgi:hypothetical protein
MIATGSLVKSKRGGKTMRVKRRLGDVLTCWLPKEDIQIIYQNVIIDVCVLRVEHVDEVVENAKQLTLF